MQETFACGPYGSCARVRNVVARLGAAGRQAIAVVAHHDSVAAGPGVADDLSGAAATVELARALAAGPPLPRPVVFLVTDGEEAGLIGATAFAGPSAATGASPGAVPWARRYEVGAVVNLEARGTTGPAILFATSGAPRWLPAALAALPRPVTTSLAAAVYAFLPNDTDLSAFETAGIPGVNLAFADGAVRYHSPRDDLAHLDPRSVQHEGDAALALVRALAAADLEHPGHEPRAWLDLLSFAVVSWRRPREVALAAALAALAAAAWLVRRERRPVRAAAWGLAAAALGALAAGAVTALLLLALRGAGALPRPFVAHPAAFRVAGWLAGVAGPLLSAGLLGRRAGSSGLLAGGALLLAGFSAALGLALPLATPLGTIPAAGVAAAAFLAGRSPGVAGALASSVAAVALAPAAIHLPPTLGVSGAVAAALLVALGTLPAVAGALDPSAPHPRRPALAALAAAFALALLQATRPQATADAPERLTFTFQVDASAARWLAEAEHDRALPAAVRAVAPFSRARSAPFPWAPMRSAFSAPAARLGLPPPRADVLSAEVEGGIRRVRIRLSSPRGAPIVALFLPASPIVLAATVEGRPLADPPPLAWRVWGGNRLVACMTTPLEGVTVDLALVGDAPAVGTLVDQSPGLPPSGAALLAARPETAVPFWEGDATVATARVEL